jgi:2-dehydro-3-deoxyglucarate aldolase/4-hydroxy-2-oxoheptanedioate aldolase
MKQQQAIKARLDAGELVRVMSVGPFPDPKLIEVVGLSGHFHGIWIDQEHSAVSHAQMELLLLACRATGMDAFARVPPTDYGTLMRPLETGCSGVMVAQVRSLDQVQQALQWVKYPPLGVRGIYLANYESDYGKRPAAEHVVSANRERWLAVQIETLEALDRVREIAAMDGVDLLFVGPADLSCALGYPGELLHPRCVEALRTVAQACRDAGKPWGSLSRTREHAQCCRDLGCQLFTVGGDLDVIQRGLQQTREVFAALFE